MTVSDIIDLSERAKDSDSFKFIEILFDMKDLDNKLDIAQFYDFFDFLKSNIKDPGNNAAFNEFTRNFNEFNRKSFEMKRFIDFYGYPNEVEVDVFLDGIFKDIPFEVLKKEMDDGFAKLNEVVNDKEYCSFLEKVSLSMGRRVNQKEAILVHAKYKNHSEYADILIDGLGSFLGGDNYRSLITFFDLLDKRKAGFEEKLANSATEVEKLKLQREFYSLMNGGFLQDAKKFLEERGNDFKESRIKSDNIEEALEGLISSENITGNLGLNGNIAKYLMVSYLEEGLYLKASGLLSSEKLALTEEARKAVINNPEIQEALKSGVRHHLDESNLSLMEGLFCNKYVPLTEETKNALRSDPEIQNGLLKLLKDEILNKDSFRGHITFERLDRFPLSKETKMALDSDLDMQNFFRDMWIKRLSAGMDKDEFNFYDKSRIDNFPLSEEAKLKIKRDPEIQSVIKDYLEKSIKLGESMNMANVKSVLSNEYIPVTEEVINALKNDPEIQNILFDYAKAQIENKNQELDNIVYLGTDKNSLLAGETVKRFNEPDFQNFLFDVVKKRIESGDINFAERIKSNEYFKLTEETIKRFEGPEFQDFLLDKMRQYVQERQVRNASKINDSTFTTQKTKEVFNSSYEGKLVKMYSKMENSPFAEFRAVKDVLIDQLLDMDNPEEAFQKVENVFSTNNIPMTGKRSKVFKILYPQEKLKGILSSNSVVSPFLKQVDIEQVYSTIFSDLINTSVKSADRDLQEYLKVMQEGQVIFDKLEKVGVGGLSEVEKRQALFILKKIRTLFEEFRYGEKVTEDFAYDKMSLDNLYKNLKNTIGVREGQAITDSIIELYVKPVGFDKIADVLDFMKKVKGEANERGRQNEGRIRNGEFEIEEGDLIKGVNSFDFVKISDGLVCREFLGNERAGSDATPLDSDFIRFPEGYKTSIEEALLHGEKNYGDIFIIIKNRNQFDNTSIQKNPIKEYDKSKYELIFSGVTHTKNHYGVRTGLPSTEFDVIAFQGEVPNRIDRLLSAIVKKGFYIPVVDRQGKLIFSYEDYLARRKSFDGLGTFDGNPLYYKEMNSSDKNFNEVEGIKQEAIAGKKDVVRVRDKIYKIINGILKEFDIETRDEFTNNILGAEIIDTGSTGRFTNTPGDFDFDLAVRLDEKDTPKINQIVNRLKEELQSTTTERSHSGSEKSLFKYQFRSDGSKGVSGEGLMDIDIMFISKAAEYDFGTHDAISEKLNWIGNNFGEGARDSVVANIIFVKKFLKGIGAYKKAKENGIGGVGVENWILANKGNALEAFRTFLEAAVDENGNKVSLGDFQKKYKLIDPGLNLRDMQHDSYFDRIGQESYDKMVEGIQDYLEKVN
ncbi:MAG TPA: hypothetical protein GX706_04070 [Candidatus Moranbacteria bacterium]|nr:hypothetical protein [Candidatus Moranbacteria bacterium]